MSLTKKEVIAHLIAEYGSLEEALATGETDGICLNCGFIEPGIEPDVEGYHCTECGEDEITGVETAIVSFL
jgi:hypothetical protein